MNRKPKKKTTARATTTPQLRLRQPVRDRWWPWRYGKVVKVLKTVVHVRWSDGELWCYDRAHQKFLVKEERVK